MVVRGRWLRPRRTPLGPGPLRECPEGSPRRIQHCLPQRHGDSRLRKQQPEGLRREVMSKHYLSSTSAAGFWKPGPQLNRSICLGAQGTAGGPNRSIWLGAQGTAGGLHHLGYEVSSHPAPSQEGQKGSGGSGCPTVKASEAASLCRRHEGQEKQHRQCNGHDQGSLAKSWPSREIDSAHQHGTHEK